METASLEIIAQIVEPLLLPITLVVLLSYSTRLTLQFVNSKRLVRFAGLITLFWAQLLSFSAEINIFDSRNLYVKPVWLATLLTGLVIQALSNSFYDAILKHLDRAYVRPYLRPQS